MFLSFRFKTLSQSKPYNYTKSKRKALKNNKNNLKSKESIILRGINNTIHRKQYRY